MFFNFLKPKVITKNSILDIEGVCVYVSHKNIKSIRLKVSPSYGKVTVSAPLFMSEKSIYDFIHSKLEWIKEHQLKFKHQKREVPQKYVNGEVHCYLGKKYELKIVENNNVPKVVLKENTIELHVRIFVKKEEKKALLQSWYREELKKIALEYIPDLEEVMNVSVSELCIKNMRTRWGTCNTRVRRIWLSTELAKKSIKSIEYVLIHEMVHLLERSHSKIFQAYMTKFLPNWRERKEELNK